jgi:hypothetical protein
MLSRKTSCEGRLAVVRVTAALAALVLLAACSASTPTPHRLQLELQWEDVSLPASAPGWRPVLRDALRCGGQWVVVGGLTGPGGSTRPAVWTSREGTSWTATEVVATEYYARQAILESAGCHDGRLAIVGAKTGGAHFLPRVRTFYERSPGMIVAAEAPSGELFGGPSGISVNRIAGGGGGWLISGTRTSGAAVWVSHRGRNFELLDDVPVLSSSPRLETVAQDAAYIDGAWTVVGSGTTASGDRVPVAWESTDGAHWAAQTVESASGFTTMERVIDSVDGALAAGLREGRFGLWQRSGSSWRALPTFGEVAADGGSAPYVSGLTAIARHVFCSISDGERFRVWFYDRTQWQELALPVSPLDTAGDHNLVVTAAGRRLLMLTDDAETPRIWVADWAATT